MRGKSSAVSEGGGTLCKVTLVKSWGATDCTLDYYDESGYQHIEVTAEQIAQKYSFDCTPGLMLIRGMSYNTGGAAVDSGDAETIWQNSDQSSRKIVIAVSGDCTISIAE